MRRKNRYEFQVTQDGIKIIDLLVDVTPGTPMVVAGPIKDMGVATEIRTAMNRDFWAQACRKPAVAHG